MSNSGSRRQPIKRSEKFPQDERHTILHRWNITDAPFPEDQTIQQLFETQVERTPDNIALMFEDNQLSYRQLKEKVNQLAHVIEINYQQHHGQSIKPDTLFALYFDRSMEMVVSILAVLKTGAAYVPVSPEYPKVHSLFIFDDAQTPLIITQQHYQSTLKEWIGELTNPPILISADSLTNDSSTSDENYNNTATDLAYVIYTSGTSGKPKGVMIEHRSLVNLITNNVNFYQFSDNETVLLLTNYVFDISILQIGLALFTGSSLIIISQQDSLSPVAIEQLIGTHYVTHIDGPASLLSLIVLENKKSLKRVVSGGEVTPIHLYEKYKEKLINEYGPTEITVSSHQYQCSSHEELSSGIPIGKPVANLRQYILDEQGEPVGIGTVGELYIGGIGLARGYLNCVDLTNNLFVNNPFATSYDNEKGYFRLYKTGDLVRCLPSGDLQYLSRNDFQVKIRGLRIELGEIESVLREISDVKEAAVVDHVHNGNKYLAAYIVLENNHLLAVDSIRASLSATLPEYMVPSSFTQIDTIPLTINGKLDRRMLPEPEFINAEKYVAPRNELEEQLCAIWQDIFGLKQVGIDDNFFRLGGDSIIAIRLTNASWQKLATNIPLALLYKLKTIAALSPHLIQKAPHLIQQKIQLIPKVKRSKYPLSFAQESLLFIENFEQGTDVYHIPHFVKLSKNINLKALEKAFNQLIDRHPIMKTVYHNDKNGRDYQCIIDANVSVQTKTVANDCELLPAVQADITVPFDLANELSIRINRYEVDENQYLLILWHHIAFDGWSNDIFMEELAKAYQSFCEDKSINLPGIEINYGDYAIWQRTYLQGELLENLLSYWKQNLADFETLRLPIDHPRPGLYDYRGKNYEFELDLSLSMQLRQLAKEKETTLYTILLSCFYVTLSSLSSQSDIIIGTPSDNRNHVQTQSLIGFFVNSLALRAKVELSMSMDDLIVHVHQLVMQAKVHQELPFELLVDALNIERDLSRHPIFQVMFLVQSFSEGVEKGSGLPFEPVNFNNNQSIHSSAKFDLSLLFSDAKKQLSGIFNYSISLFNEHSIERILAMYKRVLQALVENPKQIVGQINLLSVTERHTLLDVWNQTDKSYPRDKTLVQLFEEHVGQVPNNIALVYEEKELTYEQLNRKANQLVHAISDNLQKCYGQILKPDTLIALYVDRSVEMIVSILAVLKAGAAYVPISSEYPEERTQFILKDTKTFLIITQKEKLEYLEKCISSFVNPPLLIAANNTAELKEYSDKNPDSISSAKDLAYVIYTSGTTGQPKGVMVEHKAVINTISSMRNVYEITEEHRKSSCFSNYVFDVSVSEIFNSLCFGGEIHLLSERVRVDSELLSDYIVENNLNFLFVPPAILALLPKRQYSSLRAIIFAGEPCDQISCLYWAKKYKLYNYYGPTETTIYASGKQAVERNLNEIGKPLKNVQLYVLNDNMSPVPIGAPGELYIGGAGLSRGYLNRETLTQSRFINNPFASDVDQAKGYTKLYKTGDVVRWLPDGQLEYMGRNDFQIKIRGYRIELGEIESVLTQLSGVKQAVVVDRQGNGNKVLAAYIVSDSVIHNSHLINLLSQSLPDYMIPGSFTQLNAIPLTINGKVDRKALPEPEVVSSVIYVAPRNKLEAKLCAIWQKILGLDEIGIHDNFFRMGGNSITAIRLTAVSRQKLNKDIPLVLLFECKTIAAIAAKLDQQEMLLIPEAEDPSLLTFAQERLLFIDRFEQGTDAYHISYFVKLTDDVNMDELEAAINVVIARHPVLKSVYLNEFQDTYYQEILEIKVPIRIHTVANDIVLLQQVQAETTKPFDLSSEPSIRLNCYESKGTQYLLILWHHIAFDGWSHDIFLQELAVAYAALCQGQAVELPELDISYADYAFWQRAYLEDDTLDSLLAYWQTQLEAYETLELPTDRPRPSQIDYMGADFDFLLNEQLSTQLRELAKSHETTLYTVLLSAFYVTLVNLSSQHDVVIGTPSDNRHHAQTQSLIGFFVNSLVLRHELDLRVNVNTLINQVHQVVTQAKIHQELPFEKLVEALEIERDSSRHPIFQVMFSVQHFGEATSENAALPFVNNDLIKGNSLYQSSKYDLSLFLDDYQINIEGSFNYAVSLFDKTSIQRMATLYQQVLQGFVENQQQSLLSIDLLSESERKTLLHIWNQTDVPYQQDKSLSQLFEAWVEQTPDNIALVFEGEELTYQQLNDKSNQVAAAVRESYQEYQGEVLQADTLIGLYFDRSLEMIISILAVLKAGGAYVPISPDYPDARTQFIINDTQTRLLLTEKYFLKQLTTLVAKQSKPPYLLAVDNPGIEDYLTNNLKRIHCATDLAYVIYTSGTTGQPKGVMIEQQSVSNHLYGLCHCLGDVFKRVDFATNYCFDLSVATNLCPLLVGGCIFIYSGDITDIDLYNEHLIDNRIDFVKTTPSIASLIKTGDYQIETILMGGERLTENCLKELSASTKHIFNEYGPTEATIGTTVSHIKSLNQTDIGKGFPNVKLYVLSPQMQLVPIGTPGELFIGGAGLARGYFKRQSLTTERFVNNHFASPADKAKGYSRLYKTGDLVRWLTDGHLEYIGRNDTQIKIRGYRVELGEIEKALDEIPTVKQSVVINFEQADNQTLTAYIVAEANVELDINKLGKSLAVKLPDYMVPSTFTVIDSIPLTHNGKLNKRALPDPELISDENYVEPGNEIETKLCVVWQEILGLDKVGIQDNFFRIGGTSITAIRLIAAIRRELDRDISLKLLFEQKTIAGISSKLNQLTKIVISHKKIEKYPLSYAQERLLFIERYEQGTVIYHIPFFVKLLEDANLTLLEAAINVVIARHPVLKSVYLSDEEDKDYQQVLELEIPIQTHSVVNNEALIQQVQAEVDRPFDLTSEPSIRLHCYTSQGHRYLLILWHHIAVDGWSMDIFLRELSNAYEVLLESNKVDLPELDINYADYAYWQKNYMQGDKLDELITYWKTQLADFETLELPTDYSRPKRLDYQGIDYEFHINESLSIQLRELAKTQETTLYTVLLSAFYLTLANLSGQNDVIIGSLSDNRLHAQTQSLIGSFVNSLVLRHKLNLSDNVNELISQIHEVITQAKIHQELPFDKLVNLLGVERDSSRHPVYQVMFTVQHFGEAAADNSALPFVDNGLIKESDLYDSARFDLSLFLDDFPVAIEGSLSYAISLFDARSIQKITEMYQRILQSFVDNQQQVLADINLLSQFERETLLYTWNQTDSPYPQGKTLNQLFEEQAEQTPDNIALVFEEQELSYQQLNETANQLAHAIRKHYQEYQGEALQADTLIALYFDRSLEMIISILAVLKAGGAYVPISPDYPDVRTQFILDDTRTVLILTQECYLEQLADLTIVQSKQATMLAVDNFVTGKNYPTSNPQAIQGATDLAYVIYTSGTTGQPKGVMLEHAALVSFIHGISSHIPFNTISIMSLTQYTFDIFGLEYAMPLLTGGCVVLSEIASAHQDLEKHVDHINVIQQTPSTWNMFLQGNKSNLDLSHIQILVGGESCSAELFQQLSKIFSVVHQVYGPTETCIWSTGTVYQSGQEKNIGQPLQNERIYVLSEQMLPVPIGAKGELYIGGSGLARGYLNCKELTEERFVESPFCNEGDKSKGYNKLYKTGDVARWLTCGRLEYLGRNDFQIKIRGFRIELSEIESALTQLSTIQQAVVIDRDKNASRVLAAYIVSDTDIKTQSLENHLSLSLPDYMIPASFTQLEIIPLTINGKIDRRALPEPEYTNSDTYVAPKNDLEENLCEVWQAILGIEKIGVQDNFFRIGGDSMISMQLVSRLRRFGFNLQVKAIFDAPTIVQLAELLKESQAAVEIITEQGVLSGVFNLLPIQQGFFDKSLLNPGHWNTAVVINIPGELSQSDIEQALISLVQQHDMLRCGFESAENSYQQRYYEDALPWMASLKVLDISNLDAQALHEQLTAWQSHFNLHDGPLWQVGHLTGYVDNSARLFFACHHLIMDAFSWRIVADDLRLLLSDQSLSPKASSYRQWVQVVEQYGKSHLDELSYWQAVIADQKSFSVVESINTNLVSLSIVQTANLLQEANAGYHTEINDLLLSALALALDKIFGRSMNHITVEGHGREVLDERLDISRTVGWFTCNYPIQLVSDEAIADTIIRTKEMLRSIPNKGIGFGALVQAGALSGVLPRISFNYRGQLDSGIQQSETSLWQLSSDDWGRTIATENVDDLHLNIHGAVQKGILHFNIVSCLSAQQSQQLADAFKLALLAVTQQCLSAAQSGGVRTPSDYGMESLSVEDLRDLEESFDDNQSDPMDVQSNNTIIEL